ncbi:thioredoxin-disulfide reductase [Syntrophorhabdus aromaticivorans]|uniref:Thioredoxin reductase n=1 Tax=Syntrophorhabdus aromaticivorans TaxID=328301 RepID=A0A971S1M3_9BACT|nr:thioredoxin-disulfide reductase [Syntrophorhabdus aromaticivorans]NLW35387.1 thioredoxin-disulfide reductase [Syntrophorhabdus aromaticivorans]
MSEFHEAIIIGGGPAGLTVGIYLMRAGIDAVLVEKMAVGGTPMNYEHVENYPGFPEGISSKELMRRMAEQARRFGLVMKEFIEVEDVACENDRFTVRAGNETFESLGVVVSTGTVSLKIGIPGEAEFVGRGVSYCATCDGAFFRNLDVAIIGGGDAAVQEGLSLANIARRVYVVHRRDALRAQKIIQDRAFKNEKMQFLWNKIPIAVEGKEQVESLLIEDTKTRERSRVKVDGVFVYVGARPDTDFLGDLVVRNETGFIVTNEDLATKTAGLYIAGDARRKSLRQIATAVGDGALAAVNLERYILEKR